MGTIYLFSARRSSLPTSYSSRATFKRNVFFSRQQKAYTLLNPRCSHRRSARKANEKKKKQTRNKKRLQQPIVLQAIPQYSQSFLTPPPPIFVPCTKLVPKYHTRYLLIVHGVPVLCITTDRTYHSTYPASGAILNYTLVLVHSLAMTISDLTDISTPTTDQHQHQLRISSAPAQHRHHHSRRRTCVALG